MEPVGYTVTCPICYKLLAVREVLSPPEVTVENIRIFGEHLATEHPHAVWLAALKPETERKTEMLTLAEVDLGAPPPVGSPKPPEIVIALHELETTIDIIAERTKILIDRLNCVSSPVGPIEEVADTPNLLASSPLGQSLHLLTQKGQQIADRRSVADGRPKRRHLTL